MTSWKGSEVTTAEVLRSVRKLFIFGFCIVLVFVITFSVIFGGILSAAEDWLFEDGFLLVVMELLDMQIQVSQTNPVTRGGKFISVFAGITGFVLYSFVIAIFAGPLVKPVATYLNLWERRRKEGKAKVDPGLSPAALAFQQEAIDAAIAKIANAPGTFGSKFEKLEGSIESSQIEMKSLAQLVTLALQAWRASPVGVLPADYANEFLPTEVSGPISEEDEEEVVEREFDAKIGVERKSRRVSTAAKARIDARLASSSNPAPPALRPLSTVGNHRRSRNSYAPAEWDAHRMPVGYYDNVAVGM